METEKETDGWCQKEDIQVAWLSRFSVVPIERHPMRMRCEKCKKRFMTFVRECDDVRCYHAYMPKHKLPVKRKKKVSRKQK